MSRLRTAWDAARPVLIIAVVGFAATNTLAIIVAGMGRIWGGQ